jgi:glutamate-1-semialdehyde 2,1-aminomutase
MQTPPDIRRSAAGSALETALGAARGEYARRNPRSLEIDAAAGRFLPGGSTRSSIWHAPFPLRMVQGAGSRLTDADGHEYIDFLGEFSCGIFGHSPAPVIDAVIDALRAGVSLSAHNHREAEVAALLNARFPSMQLMRFTNSGTEANLMALAAAKAVTQRSKILVFEGAYHGSMLAFPPQGSPLTVPHEFILAPYNDIERTRASMHEHRRDLAAVLVEPMLGAGGCIPGSVAFLSSLRRAATDAGAILIFDEVQTSRLSVGGRQALLGIDPDLTTLGKYFGGGLSFGCFGGRRSIMERFDPRLAGALSHGGTFNNNTLTMAAAAAAMSTLLTAEALDALNERGERLRDAMLSRFQHQGAPFTASGLGSLMNIHPEGSAEGIAAWRELLFLDLARQGIYIAARGFMALSLAIGDEDTAALLAALDVFLAERRELYG